VTVARTGTRLGSTSRSVVAAPERGRGRGHGMGSRCLVKGLGVEVVGASGRGRGRGEDEVLPLLGARRSTVGQGRGEHGIGEGNWWGRC